MEEHNVALKRGIKGGQLLDRGEVSPRRGRPRRVIEGAYPR